jgi:hypothetical protein
MKEFMKRYRFFLRNGFDVVEAAYMAKWVSIKEFTSCECLITKKGVL